jgi:hypothetical protein
MIGGPLDGMTGCSMTGGKVVKMPTVPPDAWGKPLGRASSVYVWERDGKLWRFVGFTED